MKKQFFLCLILLQFAIPSSASAGASKEADIYKINNVKIENVSNDLVVGKQSAVDGGKKAAFDNLLKRFVTYGYIDKAPVFSFEQIDDSIKNVGVVEELVTDKKYEARMNYEFEPAKVLKLLGLKSIGELPQKQVYLLVPVLNEKGKITPWLPTWLDAWKQFKADSVTIPLGDLEDIKAVNADDLSKLNYTGFDALARRYKIPVIIMAEASFNVPTNVLTVKLIRFEEEPKQVAEYTYPGSFGIGSKELFITAANDIMNEIKKSGVPADGEALKNPRADEDIEIQYKRDFQSDERNGQVMLTASVMTRSLSDWSALRRKLLNCKLINNIVVNSFSATQTEISLYHVGEIDELQRSLAANGLDMVKQGKTYVIDRVK